MKRTVKRVLTVILTLSMFLSGNVMLWAGDMFESFPLGSGATVNFEVECNYSSAYACTHLLSSHSYNSKEATVSAVFWVKSTIDGNIVAADTGSDTDDIMAEVWLSSGDFDNNYHVLCVDTEHFAEIEYAYNDYYAYGDSYTTYYNNDMN